jgi:repressor LexA
MDNKEIFSRNLRYQMDLNQKTRQDICVALGISYFTVTSWVNGSKYPRMDKVEMLAKYFGCKKSDLIEEKKTTANDGLSEGQRMLIDFAKSVPEDKADMILRVMKSIVEAD